MIGLRRHVHRGAVLAVGFVIEPAQLGEAEARRRVLAWWTPGCEVRGVDGVWIVRLASPRRIAVHAAPGAPLVEERGVRVTVSTSSQARDYASTIGVRVRSSDGEHGLIGALFGAGDPRIVRVDGFNIEAIPDGHMVLLSNRDVPGVIGRVASRIGAAGVNIGRFYLGRKEIGGDAMALVQVDQPIDDDLVAGLVDVCQWHVCRSSSTGIGVRIRRGVQRIGHRVEYLVCAYLVAGADEHASAFDRGGLERLDTKEELVGNQRLDAFRFEDGLDEVRFLQPGAVPDFDPVGFHVGLLHEFPEDG